MEKSDRIAGGALMLAALMTVLTMMHHPTHVDPGAPGTNQLVHGIMITLVAVTGFGFAHLAIRRGLSRPDVLAGGVAYAVAMFANILAATINGFAVPSLAAQLQRGQFTDKSVFLLAWDLNQALAVIAVFTVGAAYLLWSLGLVARRGWVSRGLGALGIAAGLAPPALLALGMLNMNVAGALIVYGLEAVWTLLAGVALFSGKLIEDPV